MSAVSDVKAPAKGLYLRASLIIAALTLVGFLIAMVNEDISMRIAAATVFPAGVLIFSYPASLISRRMLARSDKLRAAGKVLFFISAMLIYLPILQTFVVMILRRVGGEKN